MDLFETLADVTRPDRDIQPDPEEVKISISEITFNEELYQLDFTAQYRYPGDGEWEYEDRDFIIELPQLEEILKSIAEKP